jgi:hypothetical protein
MKLEGSLPLSPGPATWHSQHSMERPLEEGLPIWRVAANILNEQLRTAEKGWFSGRQLGEFLTTSRSRNLRHYEAFYKVSE